METAKDNEEESKSADIIHLERISKSDINELDTDKLREVMLKGIYSLEGALFEQAGYEHQHILLLRKQLDKLEADLFKEEVFQQLSVDQKFKLWQTILNNQNVSRQFMTHLHQNVTSGLDVVNKIETLKKKQAPQDTVSGNDDKSVEGVKGLLLKFIKEKSDNSE